MKGWTLDNIPWHAFEREKVDPVMLKAVKAASLVEFNGGDYEIYLRGIFADDAEFCAAAGAWAEEEVRHGEALGRWAELADPGFDFKDAVRRFRAGYRVPLDAKDSIRGSLSGELIARCVVEVGTSSFYSSIKDVTEEPVLKEIARLIAADEFRHYKLFYDHLARYRRLERPSLWRRISVVLGRVLESGDDELCFAYHCANAMPEPFDRKSCARAYAWSAYRNYRFGHVQRAVGMSLKATGLKPYGRIGRGLAKLIWRLIQARVRKLEPAID